MHTSNDLVLLPAPYSLPFKNNKHSMIKVKFKTRTMKGAGKYGLKYDFKTFLFEIKCVDSCEGHSTCMHSLFLITSYSHVCVIVT